MVQITETDIEWVNSIRTAHGCPRLNRVRDVAKALKIVSPVRIVEYSPAHGAKIWINRNGTRYCRISRHGQQTSAHIYLEDA